MGLDQWVTIRGEKEPIAYWRKHPDLHGWMECVWRQKRWRRGGAGTKSRYDYYYTSISTRG